MKISIRIDSAAAQAQLRRWGGEFREKVKKAVAKAMAKEAREIKQDMRAQVASQLTVVKKNFLKRFSAYVIDRDKTRFLRFTWAHESPGSACMRKVEPSLQRC